MPRLAIGAPLTVRLRDEQRQLLERLADERRAQGRRPSACTPAAVLRDLLDHATTHGTQPYHRTNRTSP